MAVNNIWGNYWSNWLIPSKEAHLYWCTRIIWQSAKSIIVWYPIAEGKQKLMQRGMSAIKQINEEWPGPLWEWSHSPHQPDRKHWVCSDSQAPVQCSLLNTENGRSAEIHFTWQTKRPLIDQKYIKYSQVNLYKICIILKSLFLYFILLLKWKCDSVNVINVFTLFFYVTLFNVTVIVFFRQFITFEQRRNYPKDNLNSCMQMLWVWLCIWKSGRHSHALECTQSHWALWHCCH